MTDAERDAMRDYIVATIKGTVDAAVAQLVIPPCPAGEKGADGKDGRDGNDAVLDVSALAKEVVALVPLPKDGKDGKDAEPVDRVTLAKDVLALIPIPRDGKDGEPGAPGQHGEKGVDGKDGKDARDGRDGKDGKDGIASVDEVRAIATTAVDDRLLAEVGKQVAEAIAALPVMQYKQVFKEGTEYRPGDCVTFGGSVWHCNVATSKKPGDGSEVWTLAVKHGAYGKDAVVDISALAKDVAAILRRDAERMAR